MTIQKQLKKLEKKELISLINELSKFNKENKYFLKTKLTGDESEILKQSKLKLDKAFYSFENMSLRDARKVLTDYKKISKNSENLIELYFHYLILAQELSFDWIVQENFILAIERVFQLLINEIKKNKNLFDKYKDDIIKYIKISTEGYGLQEDLEEIFEELQIIITSKKEVGEK